MLTLVLVIAAVVAVQRAPQYDLVISGGMVVDGTGGRARKADVAVKDGRIAAVGTVARSSGRVAIDATGLVVAPGFIDVHTHGDDLADRPLASNFVHMGVTSIIAGNCGGSAQDIGTALARVADVRTSVNFSTFIGHNTVR
ncbi:MAG: D-aminoacylase, partial [Vicinamibacterales bacterium]